MIADEQTIRERIEEALRKTPLGKTVQDVQVESATDEDDEDFLRVKLILRFPDRDVDAELEAVLEKIEETVAAIDERYASVRFLDAA